MGEIMTTNEIEALVLAAEEDIKRGGFVNAERLTREAIDLLELGKSPGNEALHIRALLVMSESLLGRHMAKEALPIAERAFLLTECSAGSVIGDLGAKALGRVGSAYGMLSQNADALKYYERSIARYEELGKRAGVAYAIAGIATLYLKDFQYAKSLEYYEKALALYEEVGDKTGIAYTIGVIGVTYRGISEYAKSLSFYEQALALNEEIDYKPGVAKNTADIGIVYAYLSEYAKALEYLNKAVGLCEELGDKNGVARHTDNIGGVYRLLSQYAKALEYCEMALTLSEEIGDKWSVCFELSNIGDILHKLGRTQEAKEYFQRSLKMMREEIKLDEGASATLISIGSLLAEEEQFGEAIEKLEEGLALAEKLGERREASEAHKELATIYKKVGDSANTLEHTEKYHALKEEIFSDDTRKRVEAFNFRVATANKERDLKLARLEKEQAEAALRLKERDLANTASSLAAQTELLGNFRADLRKIVLRPDRYEPEDIIRQVKAKLKELPCEMIDFSKFEGQFATVHPEFRAKLETTYPDLTPQEVKMCMLIHVNLKTPAVARLMCLSERTVEKHRENIRKKLDVKKGEDLAELLRKLDGK